MKTNQKLTQLLAAATLGIVLASQGVHAQTGFNQTAAGPWDYNTSGNWVGNTINGIWNSTLTLSAAQTVTFGANTALTTGLDFRYDGAQNLTLRADGGPFTLTLGGNINVDTISANRTVTLGSTTANQGLNIDLGNAIRTFTVGGNAGSNSMRTLTLHNDVTNGGLVLNGGGSVNLNGNGNSLSSLRIQNAAFRISGNSSANTATTVSGAITIDGVPINSASTATHQGGIATITLTPNGSRNTALTASSLVRENNGVVFFRGNNLGGTLGANGVSNITFTTAPTLVGGGGAADSTNISILSWAVGATTASANANTFVTYDAVNGIRPLNTTTEFQNYAADYSGAVTGTANSNTRVASGTVTFTGDNTVNSLFVGESGNSTVAGNGGTLTVTSGAVFLTGTSSTISANLNFGTREGVIGYLQGQSTSFSGGIAGSGGLTVYQAHSNTSNFSSGTGTGFSGASTFTGDFTVNSRAGVSHSDFLPHADRSGNVVVNSLLTLSAMGTDSRGYTMNGLYGTGVLSKGNSGAGLFRIGDNDSNGDFSGIITDGGNTVIQKIGTGTQIFSGANAHNGATQVLGGTLQVTILADGLSNSGVGRTSNVASNLVLNGGTLKYVGDATSTDRLFTVGALGGSLDASGTGAAAFTNLGNNASSEAANRAGARTTGSNVVTGVTNFADLVVGARVTGTGITAGTTITAIDTVGGTITLSANATADSSANMSFITNRVLALTGSNTGANTISGVLANASSGGTLGVSKSGDGTWVLGGINTYTGATSVSAGTLLINGSTAAGSAVSVALDAVLGGSGTIHGDLTLANGALFAFAPNSTLTVGGTLALDSSFGVDSLRSTSGGAIDWGSIANNTYTLMNTSFAFDDTKIANYGIDNAADIGGGREAYFQNGSLQLVVIPEPSTLILVGVALGSLLAFRKRKR